MYWPTVYVVDRTANVGHVRKVFNGEHVTWCGERFGPDNRDVRRYSTTELLAPERPVCKACAAARDAAEAAELAAAGRALIERHGLPCELLCTRAHTSACDVCRAELPPAMRD